MRTLRLVPPALMALLAACGSTPPAPPSANAGGATAPRAASTAPPPTTLPAEYKRLSALFQGTPVLIELQRDGSLRSQVPLKYAFDPGKAVVKPPLAAVLDRLVPSAKLSNVQVRIAPPAEAKAKAAGSVVRERAASARDYLVGKGVAPTQFAPFAAPLADAIEIVIARP